MWVIIIFEEDGHTIATLIGPFLSMRGAENYCERNDILGNFAILALERPS